MRCPSCGTENAPDSRFCGGCGARLEAAPVAARVAPTGKVSDDAAYAPPRMPSAPLFGSGPAAARAPTPSPVMPPPSAIAPTPRAVSAPPVRPPLAAMSDPSLSMPIVRRPVGLIVVVTVIDLALAGTGALLLAKGLSSHPAKAGAGAPARAATPATSAAPPPPPPPAATAAAPTPPPPAPADASAPVEPAAAPPPPPTPPPAKDKAAAMRHDEKKPPTKPHGGGVTGTPQDPYGSPRSELDNEVDLTATRSKPAFDRCYQTAVGGADGQLHGEVKIAFQVTPDGHVTHTQAVANTTGSPQLASCLAANIKAWVFAVHPAQSTDFVRPFSYP